MLSLYERLADTDVRLVTIAVHDGAVSLELRTYPRAAAPEYDALSYHWGNDASTTSTTCNGLPLDIRTNLFTALPSICNFRPEPRTRPLWIDAICLNQKDDEEKAIQVSLMGKVYENATRTLIWLGEAADGSDLAIDNIESLVEGLLGVKSHGSLMVTQVLEKHNLPPYNDPTWKRIEALELRPWFHRLWTFQEIILSKAPILLCGSKTIEWDRLALLHHASSEARLTGLLYREGEDGRDRVSRRLMHGIEFLRRNFNKRDHISIPMLLNLSEDRGYSLPVDRIWALVGIVNQNYQELIRRAKVIKYGDDAISNYHESFLKIVELHIKHNGALAMQLIENNARSLRNEHLPSWCPDWHTNRGEISLAQMPQAYAGIPGAKRPHIKPFMKANKDGSLELYGLMIDVVDRVTTSPGRGMLNLASYPWLDECVEIIKNTPFVPYAVYPEAVAITTAPITWPNGSPMEEKLQRYKRAENLLIDVLYPLSLFSEESGRTILRCNGRNFLSTKGGRFGIGPADLKKNDLLCAMYGARTIWALRPYGSGAAFQGLGTDASSVYEIEKQEFELLGSVHTPSLLSGEAWVGVSCESMRRFKLR